MNLGQAVQMMLAFAILGCGGGRGAMIDLTLPVAIAVSAKRHADGECYVSCLPGTRCNRVTGYCDAVPCRGECGPNEHCEESNLSSRCVGTDAALRISRPGAP